MATDVNFGIKWPNYDPANTVVKSADKTMGKDDFLKILVTQLQNQDPMEPLQDREFIAQMAQFTSVEQLMNMSTQLGLIRQNLGSASSLIGKAVEWFEYDDAGTSHIKTDIVQSIVLSSGAQYVKFSDDTMLLLDDVVSISDTINEDQDVPAEDGSETPEGAETP
ncbi:MAG: flagellar hook capping FlgD N-terminal domain-containing protein [Candidatus Pristimantibacillus sp.]